jgi:hypothetical protein
VAWHPAANAIKQNEIEFSKSIKGRPSIHSSACANCKTPSNQVLHGNQPNGFRFKYGQSKDHVNNRQVSRHPALISTKQIEQGKLDAH